MAELAHRLAYYKDIVTHGSAVRLNIYQKTNLYPLVQEIGDVLVSLSYGIQGSGEAVDEPIQKTSLEFSLADAPERNTQKERWGGWETFYTPDATGYKVELLIDGAIRWTGFITPDSWEEDLSWHAPVTITARDNWGRLQDFMFDLAGDEDHLISVADLLTAAAEKAEVAMEVVVNEDVAWPICDGFPLYQHMINVLAFKDRTWWDALYDTLGSLGLVLTYEDGNRFVLAPLRSRVAKGEGKEFKFVASGHRSLAPAVREIVETQNYEFSEDMINAPVLTIADFNAGSTYPFTTQPYGVTEKAMPVFSLRSGGFWKQGASGYYSLFCQFNYTPRDNDDKVRLTDGKTLFLACNPGTAVDYSTAQNQMRGVYCELNMTKMRAELSFRVGAPVRLYGSDYNTGTAPYAAEVTSPAIASIHARIVYTPATGTVMSYNGTKWVTGNVTCAITPPTNEAAVYEAAFAIPSADIDEPGVLRIEFLCGKYIIRGEYTDAGSGMYMPITELKMTSVWATEAENKVTTKYNEGNNVILERQPAIGCLNFDTTSPNEVRNGVYTPTLGRPASREWRWSDEDDTTYQLPVLLHKELLCYHGKPNNVLTGEMIVDDLKGLPSFDCLWLWRGKEHLLMAGRVNLVSGTMEGAELREFVRYEDLWGSASYPNGVYVQHIDGRLFKAEEWAAKGYNYDDANGVAVVSDACRFVIAKTERRNTSWQNTATLIEGVATFTSLESAITDFGGANNTDLMTNSVAKSYCSGYTFPNGQQGYLGSAGEWNEFLKNYDAVNSAMKSIGGEYFGSKKYWTSTQESQSKAWICTTIVKQLYAENKIYGTSVEYARPFGKI